MEREMYLQVLRHVQYTSDILRVLLVELAESIQKILRFNLPNSHEHKLMVGMSREEHCEQALRIFKPNIVPRQTLTYSVSARHRQRYA